MREGRLPLLVKLPPPSCTRYRCRPQAVHTGKRHARRPWLGAFAGPDATWCPRPSQQLLAAGVSRRHACRRLMHCSQGRSSSLRGRPACTCARASVSIFPSHAAMRALAQHILEQLLDKINVGHDHAATAVSLEPELIHRFAVARVSIRPLGLLRPCG